MKELNLIDWSGCYEDSPHFLTPSLEPTEAGKEIPARQPSPGSPFHHTQNRPSVVKGAPEDGQIRWPGRRGGRRIRSLGRPDRGSGPENGVPGSPVSGPCPCRSRSGHHRAEWPSSSPFQGGSTKPCEGGSGAPGWLDPEGPGSGPAAPSHCRQDGSTEDGP